MGFIVILLAVITVALLGITAFDFVPAVMDILARRGMGSFNSDREWLSAAENTVDNWLENGVPVVPKNAEKGYRFFSVIKGDRKVTAIQHWQEASVLLAANEVGSPAADEFIKDLLSEGGAFNSDRVDTAMLAFAILCNNNTDKDEVKPYMDKIANMILEKYRRTGRIPYGNNNYDICFVDTIGLVCPFLIRYSLEYNDSEALDAAMKVITDYAKTGIHKELNLPVHCYDSGNDAPLGIYGWGRGCGWWATGLADSFRQLNMLDGHYEEQTKLLRLMISFADTIIKYQCDDGAFDRNVLHFSGKDSSATAMLAYFLAYTGRLTKREKYISAAEKAVKYLYTVTRKDGTVDYSQGDTMGVGFYSAASIVVPATQGFAVRAFLELEGADK